MTDYELWQHLLRYGQLSNGWWYEIGVLPATLLAGLAYLFTCFVLRHETHLPKMFTWLSGASLPLLLILPSAYLNTAPRAALSRLSFPAASDVQQLPFAAVLEAGRAASQLATLGIAGTVLALGLVCLGLQRGGYAPPVFDKISQSFTKAVTRTFSRRPAARPVLSSQHGVVRVLRGQQQGSSFGVKHGALIGKEQATMTLTDAIVSRRHARFEIRGELPHLIDEGSTNGTHLRRGGSVETLNGHAVALEHGDAIFLGHPEEPESVELIFELAA